MNRAIKCAGWVLVGVSWVLGIVSGIVIGLIALVTAGFKTAAMFGLPEGAGLIFMMGYAFTFAGICFGIQLCREHANE